MKRTSISLTDEMHEQLRKEAFRRRVSMAEVIRARIEGRSARRKRAASKRDPLAAAIGIIRNGTLTRGLDEELY